MEWLLVKDIMILWIVNHPEHNIDDSLALWLDPIGTLHKNYKVTIYRSTSFVPSLPFILIFFMNNGKLKSTFIF